MTQDDVINKLTSDLCPCRPCCPVQSSLRIMLLAALAGAGLLLVFGVRADLAVSLQTVFPYWKSGMFALIGTGALVMAVRLGLPARGIGVAGPVMMMAGIAGLLAFVGGAMIAAPSRDAMIADLNLDKREFCLANVLGLGLLVFLAGSLVLRRLAYMRPRLAGALLGVASGALVASLYAWHCPYDAVLYVAVWYSVPLLMLAGIGALLGGRLLRM